MDSLTNAAVSMTSAEIADLVGSRHDNVKKSIERLVNQGVVVQPAMEVERQLDSVGRPRLVQVYRFIGERGKRDSIIVVAQLSPEFTARLVDRWRELEDMVAEPCGFVIPKTLPDALRLAADLADGKAAAEAALALAAPKASALDRLETGTDGSFCLTDAAKALQVPPRKLVAKLQGMGWIYRRPMGSGWLAYQERLAMGVLEHKVTTGDRANGTEWASTQVRVTSKGMARLALVIEREAARAQ